MMLGAKVYALYYNAYLLPLATWYCAVNSKDAVLYWTFTDEITKVTKKGSIIKKNCVLDWNEKKSEIFFEKCIEYAVGKKDIEKNTGDRYRND